MKDFLNFFRILRGRHFCLLTTIHASLMQAHSSLHGRCFIATAIIGKISKMMINKEEEVRFYYSMIGN